MKPDPDLHRPNHDHRPSALIVILLIALFAVGALFASRLFGWPS